ncbi:MAG: hypothetical protein AAFR98_07935 [Pseudomonadota bacterium]
MTKILLATLTAGMLATSAAYAGPIRFWDRAENRADRYEDRIDRRVTWGPRDRIEDRADTAENRLDRRNLGKRCAAAKDIDCQSEAGERVEARRTTLQDMRN